MARRVTIVGYDIWACEILLKLGSCGYHVRQLYKGDQSEPLDIVLFTLEDNTTLTWLENRCVRTSPDLHKVCPHLTRQSAMFIAIRPGHIDPISIIKAIQLYERWLIKKIGVPWNATKWENRLTPPQKTWRDRILPLLEGTEWERTPRMHVDVSEPRGLVVSLSGHHGAWGRW